MEEMNHPVAFKFVIEKMLAPFVSVIIALTVQGLISRNKKIKNSATMEDLHKSEEATRQYTDDELRKHLSYSHVNIIADIKEMKDSNKEVNNKLDKLLLLMIGNKK